LPYDELKTVASGQVEVHCGDSKASAWGLLLLMMIIFRLTVNNLKLILKYNTTTTALWPFVRDYPGQLVPEETLTTQSLSASSIYHDP